MRALQIWEPAAASCFRCISCIFFLSLFLCFFFFRARPLTGTSTRSSCPVDISSVTRITKGQTTIPFIRQEKNAAIKAKAALSFSIIYENYKGDETSLDLVCEDEAQFNAWFSELTALVTFTNINKNCEDRVLRFTKRQWALADTDGNGSLDIKEITSLVKKLNIDLEPSYIKRTFAEIDVDKSGTLDYIEFQALLSELSKRDDIYAIWVALHTGAIFKGGFSVASFLQSKPKASYRDAVLEPEVFHKFLTETQKATITLDETKLKIAASASEGASSDGKMRFSDFVEYLTSGENAAYSVEARSSVYMDMNQPLSHYWCASSHNTYCESDQLKGYSSVNRYINDLTKGCRCVELDCWDGPKGDPIIFHGHTLTGQIKFKDVIQAVKDYGFVTSEYPVILSFENHCSIPQQKQMATYCKKILGKLLVVPDLRSDGTLPSPEECKGKVLIKAKRLPHPSKIVSSPSSVSSDDDREDVDEDFAEQQKLQESAQPTIKGVSETPSGPLKDEKKKGKKKKIAEELSAITFLAGVHFKSWEKSAAEAER